MDQHSSSLIESLSDRGRWTLIMAELAGCYLLLYLATTLRWPHYEYLRFLALIPIYHAAVWFSYNGGITVSILSSLLFLPILQIDPKITGDATGLYHGLVMILALIVFGLFVAGTIGAGLQNQRRLRRLSRITWEVAQELDREQVLPRLAREAMRITDCNCAAVIGVPRGGEEPSALLVFESADPPTARVADPPTAHPLLWALEGGESLITNSAASDPRFRGRGLGSLMVLPVASGNERFGAIMLAEKRNQEHFSGNDFSMARLLAGVAARTIQNIDQEYARQQEQLREDRMKQLFSRFVSSSVAEYVLKNPELLQGRWQEVTLLVSDIRGFTSISERLSPQELVEQLNEYFTVMVDIIFDNKGAVDKFVGDCIIAYWGAPAPDADHAANAARTARLMTRALDRLNADWTRAGRPAFVNGIALHTCRALMGNLGDERKRAFTVMGEEVERTLGLESLTKTLGVRAVMSRETASRLGSEFGMKRIHGETAGFPGGLFELVLE